MVEGNHTVYRISAPTPEEKEEWIKCIRWVLLGPAPRPASPHSPRPKAAPLPLLPLLRAAALSSPRRV